MWDRELTRLAETVRHPVMRRSATNARTSLPKALTHLFFKRKMSDSRVISVVAISNLHTLWDPHHPIYGVVPKRASPGREASLPRAQTRRFTSRECPAQRSQLVTRLMPNARAFPAVSVGYYPRSSATRV